MMTAKPTNLEGVWLIEPPRWVDHRGAIAQIWNRADYIDCRLAHGLPHPQWPESREWVQENVTFSTENVLRGIHVSPNLWKLATCVYGRIFLVVVDCRITLGVNELQRSKLNYNFGQWKSWTIDHSDSIMILVPPGFGLAHLVLSKQAVFYYKWSGLYDGPEQLSFRYDNPRFGIKWPLEGTPILSERDGG